MLGVTFDATWPGPLGEGFSLRADSLLWAGRTLHDAFVDATISQDEIAFLCGNSSEDRDRIHLWGTAGRSTEGYAFALDSLFVEVEQIALSNLGPCRVRYHPVTGLRVDRFRLAGPAGRVYGRDDPDSADTVDVRFEDMDLRSWAFFLGMGDDLSGILSGDVQLSGTLDDPQVSGRIHLRDASLFSYWFA